MLAGECQPNWYDLIRLTLRAKIGRKEAPAEEKAAAWGNYFGYFGTYTLDEQARVLTHHIEGSWFPNLVGTKQVRYYHFEGSRLILDADTEWGQVRIVWKKVQS
jgi:hypothetical protein